MNATEMVVLGEKFHCVDVTAVNMRSLYLLAIKLATKLGEDDEVKKWAEARHNKTPGEEADAAAMELARHGIRIESDQFKQLEKRVSELENRLVVKYPKNKRPESDNPY